MICRLPRNETVLSSRSKGCTLLRFLPQLVFRIDRLSDLEALGNNVCAATVSSKYVLLRTCFQSVVPG